MEKEIQIVNKIIREAVIHGADAGGSYDQNEENLIDSIKAWLNLKGLNDEYDIDIIPVGDGWSVYQIIKQ